MRRSRPRALLLGILCVFAGVTCTDKGLTGPDGGLRGRVGILPSLTAAASQIYQNLVVFGLELDNVHLQLKRRSGELVKDTVIVIGDNTDEIRVEITVQLRSSEELLDALVELRDGTEVLFSGTQQIIARSGQSGADRPPLEVNYTGPGSTAATLSVSPADRTIFTTDSIDFTAAALDVNEQSVPVVAIAWSVEDAARGTITATGRFKPSQSRGTTRVIAKLPTGLTAFANVSIVPTASQMSLVSGGSQNGTVGSALAQPIVVEVRAGDNLPVPGVPVEFAVVAGGGSVSLASGITDAAGRASTTLTLGTVAGANAVSVTSGAITPITVTATGKPANASKLAILQQPSTSATAGVPLAIQPKVKLLDLYNNVVPAAGVAVHASTSATSGPQLGGTVTALTDGTGVATFTDLLLTGATGTTSLVFAQDTLDSVTSTAITVALGAPATLTLSSSTPITLVAGSAFSGAPVVTVKDAAGNLVPGVAVQLTMAGGGATLYDASHTTDANGSVSVGVIPVPLVAGSYQISATSGSLAGSPTQLPVTITHADPSQLVFINQPSGTAGVAGTLLDPIVVELRDQFGNRVTTGAASQTAITLSKAPDTSSASLGPSPSDLTKNAVNGRATFNVSFNFPANGLAIVASATATPPIASATTSTFNIVSAGSARLAVLQGAEQAALPRRMLVDSVAVRALDPNSTPLVGIPVTFSVTGGAGSVNGGLPSVDVITDANGRAAVAWTVGTGAQQLTISMSGATEQVRAYAADRLEIVTEPSASPQSGTVLAQQPVVRFSDGSPRVFHAAGEFIQAQLVMDAGTPTGFLTSASVVTDANGVARFTQLTLTGPTTEAVHLRFFHRAPSVENPDIVAAVSVTLVPTAGLASVIEVADPSDRHRVAPLTRLPLKFAVRDGINMIPNENVNVLLIQGATACSAPSVVTTDASGIATVDVTAGGDFTSCRVMAQLQRTVPDGQGGTFQPIAWQSVYATADSRVPLWVGGTNKDPDPTGWTAPENWFDGAVPQTEPVVFVPAAVDFWPIAKTSLNLPTLELESGGLLDLGRNGLTISGSLRGGGSITNAGGVLLAAIKGETVHAHIDGPVHLGEKDKSSCTQAEPAYTVTGYLFAGALELNCGLVVDGASILSVAGDLLVQSAGGNLQQNSGGTSIGRDATFNSGFSRIVGESFSVAGKLVVGPAARFDQLKGVILVEGDAIFDGNSTLSDGLLRVNGSLFHTGNGDNTRLVAALPHVTQLGNEKEGGLISWSLLSANRNSKLGRLEVWDRSAAGYRFTNADDRLPTIIDIDDVYVGPGSQLFVPSFFTINAGGQIGRGVTVEKDGKLTNDGQVIVLNTGVECSPLPKGALPSPFQCVMK